MDYWNADDEVKTMAEMEVIPKWHPELAEARIAYIFAEEMKSRGSIVAAKIKKASSMENFLSEYDLILIVSAEEWKRFNAAQRLALIDHELCHVTTKEDEKTGETKYVMVNHDFEEFVDVLKRHRIWHPDLEELAQVMDRVNAETSEHQATEGD